MVYARFDEGDVYVFVTISGDIEIRVRGGVGSTVEETRLGALEKLLKLRASGTQVPDACLKRLTSEAKDDLGVKVLLEEERPPDDLTNRFRETSFAQGGEFDFTVEDHPDLSSYLITALQGIDAYVRLEVLDDAGSLSVSVIEFKDGMGKTYCSQQVPIKIVRTARHPDMIVQHAVETCIKKLKTGEEEDGSRHEQD